MQRPNRVDPWGDLHRVAGRGLFTGNRGCLVDTTGRIVRHHATTAWITCLTSYRGWRHPLAAPRTWTPLFFLDDAVALAAGHRPCALCRRPDYRSYRSAVSGAGTARELDRRLAAERHRRGRGLERAADRILWTAPVGRLPDATVVVGSDDVTRLVVGDRLLAFDFAGWADPIPRPVRGDIRVLTPPVSVEALRGGFEPLLHASARPPNSV